MKKINGKLVVNLTIDDVNYINTLLERDNPKAMRKYETSEGTHILDMCSVCGAVLGKTDNYCNKCGQRVDHENYAFI